MLFSFFNHFCFR